MDRGEREVLVVEAEVEAGERVPQFGESLFCADVEHVLAGLDTGPEELLRERALPGARAAGEQYRPVPGEPPYNIPSKTASPSRGRSW